uniref:Putative secreted peptide n=1 Tax=Anopheles braziliensis TaxID=58242 RepID=A0A2M3ZS30_9DIPT
MLLLLLTTFFTSSRLPPLVTASWAATSFLACFFDIFVEALTVTAGPSELELDSSRRARDAATAAAAWRFFSRRWAESWDELLDELVDSEADESVPELLLPVSELEEDRCCTWWCIDWCIWCCCCWCR